MRIAHRFRMEAGLPSPGAFRVVRTVRAARRVLQIARQSVRSRLEVLRTAANLVVPGLVLQIARGPAARTVRRSLRSSQAR